MVKPKLLTGEVKAFEEVVRAHTYQEIYNSDLIKFYTQGFEPEMSIQYFTGFISNGGNEYLIDDCYILFADGHFSICRNIDDYLFECAFLPKTLSQFISNMNQAGIELTWKGK